MSLLRATTPDETIIKCHYPPCNTTKPKRKTKHGKYCSADHWHLDRANDILTTLDKDHTHCAACGTRLKTVYYFDTYTVAISTTKSRNKTLGERRPPDNFTGYQSRTKDADIDHSGTICGECGATNHRDTYNRRFDLDGFLENLVWYVNNEIEGYALVYDDLVFELFGDEDRCVRFELALGRALEPME